MTIRAKSRKRLLLLLLLACLVGATGTTLYMRREGELDAEARRARAQGLEAFERGAYPIAVTKLGSFLRRLDPDPLALLRYAQAIELLPEKGSDHIQSAVAALRHCVQLDPDHEEARRTLLELYLTHGIRAEALVQANWLLDKHPNDDAALRAKARTLAAMSQFKEARDFLRDQAERRRLPFEEQLLYLTVLAETRASPAEILETATELGSRNPADMRARLLKARALGLGKDRTRAKKQLQAIVGSVPPQDAEFARLVLPDLDGAGMASEALIILKALDPKKLDAELQAELIRRLWEAEEADEVPAFVEAMDADLQALPTPVLGYAALAWRRIGEVPNAASATAILGKREAQDAARAWALLLREVILPEKARVGTRLKACLEATAIDPSNVQCRFFLGLIYGEIGEDELAVRALREAAALARGWAAPIAAAANLLGKRGRFGDALQAARSADALGSPDPGVTLLVAIARGASASEAGSKMNFTARLLRGLDEKGVRSTDVLPIRLALLATLGRVPQVKALLEEVLVADEKPAAELLLSGASLSRALALDLEERCLRRYRALYGDTPEYALALARQQAAQGGDGTVALTTWRERREAASDGDTAAWDLSEAALYLALGQTAEALRCCRTATTRAELEPAQLQSILSTKIAWTDRELVKKVIDLLRATTDDSCLGWRYEEARWLLDSPERTTTAIQQAKAHLESILRVAKEHVRARLLLAEVYARQGDTRQALEELIQARGYIAPSVAMDLQIARLQSEVGSNTAALDMLKRILASGRTSEYATAIASSFVRLGEGELAAEMLQQIPDNAGRAQERQRRAEIFAAAGRLKRAERLVQSVLAVDQSAQALQLAAALAVFRGDTAASEALVRRMMAATPDPLERERAAARHFRGLGDLAQAELHLLRAVDMNKSEASDWLALMACQVLQGKSDAVSATWKRARDQLALATGFAPNSPDETLIREAAERALLRGLGASYLEDANHRVVAAEALGLLLESLVEESTESQRIKLRSLAHTHVDFLALQIAVADFLAGATDYEDAIDLYRTAMGRFPTSPQPARGLAYCQASRGRTDLAVQAATEWRKRSTGSAPTLAPDLFLAGLSTPQRAVELLAPYLPGALERGDASILLVYGRSLVWQGELARARALLEPHLRGNAGVALTWVHLAGIAASRGEAAAAEEWLRHEALRDDAVQPRRVQIELAVAWQAVAKSTGKDAYRRLSRDYLKRATGDGEPAPNEWERIGLAHEGNGDVKLAEAAFRKALSGDRERLAALNNLTMILARSDRSREALPLAKRLVAMGLDEPEYRDTLAFVQTQLRDLASALTEYEKCVMLDATNARWAVRVVKTLLAQRRRDAAKDRFDEFKRRYDKRKMAPDVLAEWIELERELS